MKSIRVFKFRIYPTNQQKILLGNHFGASRWVYNWCLARKTAQYVIDGNTLSKFDLDKEVTALKKLPETKWLKEVSAQSLQAAIADLDVAYNRFFRKDSKFPKFKSKKFSKNTSRFSQFNKVSFENKKIYIPKFREGIKCVFSREFEGVIKSITVSMTTTGKYFASILVDVEIPQVKKYPVEFDKAIGIDLGIKTLATLSDGREISNQKNRAAFERKLAKANRKLAKKKKGSKNRNKQRKKVAAVYEKITNRNTDYLHKVTRQLVDDSQVTTYCLETLSISGMMKNHKLAKAIASVSWHKFVKFLEYKADRAGKNVLRIGRFEPSSKTCNCCGLVNKNLKLSDRTWTCECGTTHQRDVLAANNIKRFAFAPQNLIGAGCAESKSVEKPSHAGRSVKQKVRS